MVVSEERVVMVSVHGAAHAALVVVVHAPFVEVDAFSKRVRLMIEEHANGRAVVLLVDGNAPLVVSVDGTIGDIIKGCGKPGSAPRSASFTSFLRDCSL